MGSGHLRNCFLRLEHISYHRGLGQLMKLAELSLQENTNTVPTKPPETGAATTGGDTGNTFR